jgi:hypothetical protein
MHLFLDVDGVLSRCGENPPANDRVTCWGLAQAHLDRCGQVLFGVTL